MKHTLFLFIISILALQVSYACPECNIHNYLASSVRSSWYIYKGKIIEKTDKHKAKVEILEMIGPRNLLNFKIGQTKEEYIYDDSKIGDILIFSKPVSLGPNYPILPIELEDEIKFLLDSGRMIKDIQEAILRTEGISVESVAAGIIYIKAHYLESYPVLEKRIRTFRSQIFKDPNHFFACYRISNLTRAVLLSDYKPAVDFLLSEIDTLNKSKPLIYPFDNFPLSGDTPQGRFLRAMLQYSKSFDSTHRLIKDKMLHSLKNSESFHIVYFSYALSFFDLEENEFKDLNPEQKNFAALGIAYSALWNKIWFRQELQKRLVNIARKFSADKKLNRTLDKYFGDEY